MYSGCAFLETAALTGKSLSVSLPKGCKALRGSTNVGETFDLGESHLAEERAYSGIARQLEDAQRSKAPISRLAGR